MARLIRAVDLGDALKRINDASSGMSAEEKRGMRAAVRALVQCVSVNAHNVVFAEPRGGKCSSCGAGIGRMDEWCPSCGALLDLKMQHFMTDQAVMLRRELNKILERLEEKTA